MIFKYEVAEILSEESDLSIDEIDALPDRELRLIREVLQQNQAIIDHSKTCIAAKRRKAVEIEHEISDLTESLDLYQSDKNCLDAGLKEIERHLLIRPCPGQLPLFEVAA